MDSYKYMLDLAVILLCTKFFGLFTRKFKMPQVVGALLAGIILGPAVLNILNETEFIDQVSKLGVIILMFIAGLETDIKEFKKAGLASFFIALIGVVIPLAGGFVTASFFNNTGEPFALSNHQLLENIFIGIILTATSVSITVETLREFGKLKSPVGTAILGAAIIDDILGIIGLTIVASFSSAESTSMMNIFINLILFGFTMGAAGYLYYYFVKMWLGKFERNMRRFTIMAFVFCLIMAYYSEEFFGVADITGAFIAGMIISNLPYSDAIVKKFEVLSYLFLAPVFFASIGPFRSNYRKCRQISFGFPSFF